MKVLKVFYILVFSLGLYAHSQDILLYEDTFKYDQISEPTSSEELSKISVLEREVQNLTGRIEVLEHELLRLKKPVASEDALSEMDLSTTDVKAQKNIADPKQEKREYDMALSNLKDENYANAEKLFYEFIHQYPKSQNLSNAHFWYAESFFRRGDYDKAAINFLKGYQKFPSSTKAPDSLLKLALALGEMGKKSEACSILKKLDLEFKKRSESSIKRAYDAKIRYGCK